MTKRSAFRKGGSSRTGHGSQCTSQPVGALPFEWRRVDEHCRLSQVLPSHSECHLIGCDPTSCGNL